MGRFSDWLTEPSSAQPDSAPADSAQSDSASRTDGTLEEQTRALLEHRLRAASAFTLAGSAAFLLVFLRAPGTLYSTPGDLLGLIFMVATLAAVTAMVWLRRGWSMPVLRSLELAGLASAAAFFTRQQYEWFRSDRVFEMAAEGRVGDVAQLAAFSFALRWDSLMLIYGLFIPNTRTRGTVVLALLVLCPTVALLLAAANHPSELPFVGAAVTPTAIHLALMAAVAGYGSHKLQALRQREHDFRRLGQYRLKRKLGSGGMGDVFLAEHMLLRRPCAIKVIRARDAGGDEAVRRFEREVRTTARLTHPNTIEIYDYGRTADGTFYYAMQYLVGRSAADLVHEFGPMPPGRVVHLLRQVCSALREAHRVGLVHRDIKPGNIMLCERGGLFDVAKLLDFGLVIAHDGGPDDGGRLTVEGTSMGTPAFMSPEQARGDELDARSDLYSLGAVAYALLTGQPPFVRKNRMQVMLAHTVEPVVPPRELNPAVTEDLQAVVLRALAKAPQDRFADAGEMEQAVAGCACASQWSPSEAEQWWRVHPLALPAGDEPTESGLSIVLERRRSLSKQSDPSSQPSDGEP